MNPVVRTAFNFTFTSVPTSFGEPTLVVAVGANGMKGECYCIMYRRKPFLAFHSNHFFWLWLVYLKTLAASSVSFSTNTFGQTASITGSLYVSAQVNAQVATASPFVAYVTGTLESSLTASFGQLLSGTLAVQDSSMR